MTVFDLLCQVPSSSVGSGISVATTIAETTVARKGERRVRRSIVVVGINIALVSDSKELRFLACPACLSCLA